ncbi:MAG TPA: hypothetical protein VF705_07300 [Longimicrobium sp.]|jgi:hypothetical protein
MIHVKRISEPAAVARALARTGRDNKTELQVAREYYRAVPPPEKAYNFKRYKEWEVCHALDDLFHGKCAYCETPYLAADARDVEHYRPKGGVSECDGHPGYWWLAAVWRNLLPSCPPCNQARRQTVFTPGMTPGELERARLRKPVRLSGKANSFPQRNGQWARAEAEDLAAEDPLLINPCERDPADHLEWVFDRDATKYVWEDESVIALVRPRVHGGVEDPYGRASVDIYGLNRMGLVRVRTEWLKKMQVLCRHVVDLAGDLPALPSAADLARMQSRLQTYRDDLMAYTADSEPWAGMSRAFAALFEQDLVRLANETPD